MITKGRAVLACLTAILFASIALPPLLPTLLAEDANPAPAPAASEKILLRDPFWPVGYWPKAKTSEPSTNKAPVSRDDGPPPPPPPPPDPPPKWPDLRVKGIFGPTPSGYMATIEGIGVVQAGQTVRKQEGKYEYFWKINSVSAKGVSATQSDVRKIKQ